MNLITGYKGYKHVKSEDIAAFNRCVFGSGAYVLNTGKCFAAELADTNVIRIYDGELLICGYHARTDPGSYDDVALTAGTAGIYRHDYIVAQYEKKADGTEEVSFLDVCGTGASTADAAALPSLVQNDLPNYGTVYQMPLYTILFSGLSAGDPVPVFAPIENLPAQIQKKQDTITGGASSIAKSNLTGGRALISDSNGKVGVSSATSTELSYLSGLGSNAQKQLDNLLNAFKDITYCSGVAATSNITSKWDWTHLKFTSANYSFGTQSPALSSDGQWVSPAEGFIFVSVDIQFAANTSGSRACQLLRVTSSGTSNICRCVSSGAGHIQYLNIAGATIIKKGESLKLQVGQDSGKTLATYASYRLLFIPNK